MKHFLFTLVILNPYVGLNYDDINVYEIEENFYEVEIVEHLSDGYSELDPNNDPNPVKPLTFEELNDIITRSIYSEN